MHKYNMIRRQCVKLKAQTHLNMPIVYILCTIVWISLQKYFQLFHIETTFIINLLRSSLKYSHVNTAVVLYMINIRPSSPPPPLAFSFIILFRSSSIFLRASSRALAASDFSFGFLFEGVFLETVLLFFTGSGF